MAGVRDRNGSCLVLRDRPSRKWEVRNQDSAQAKVDLKGEGR